MQKMCKTRFALAGNAGGFGARGRLSGPGGPAASSPRSASRATQGDPAHARGHVGEEAAAIEQVLAEQSLGT